MTLTQASELTKKGLLFLIFGTIVGIIGILTFNIAYQIYIKYIKPPVIEMPAQNFGVLPKIAFPKSDTSSSKFTYSLVTTTGNLPDNLPRLLKVYFIPRAKTTFLAPAKSKTLAEKLGFNYGPDILSSTQVRYRDGYENELVIEQATGNFYFTRYNRTKPTPTTTPAAPTPTPKSTRARIPTLTPTKTPTPTPIPPKNLGLPNQNSLIEEYQKYLESKELLTNDLKNGIYKVKYNGLTPAESDTAIVSIWPSAIEKYPIVTFDFDSSLIKMTVVKGGSDFERYAKLSYTYWPVEKQNYSTYPLKSVQKAYEELKAGEGFVSIIPPSNNVSISKVYLAYLQTEEYTPFLQPVYVFEGPDFAALVLAVDLNPSPAKK